MIDSAAPSLMREVEQLLARVEKPARYIGAEFLSARAGAPVGSPAQAVAREQEPAPALEPAFAATPIAGAVQAQPAAEEQEPVPTLEPKLRRAQGSLDVVLAYPDIYDIGASNQALVILYEVVRRLDAAQVAALPLGVERVYVPWLDMAAQLRAAALPLMTLETQRAVRAFDVLGITLPHELIATNICELLDLAGIALKACNRGEHDPLVIGGGPVALSPAPFAPFFDALCIGEGEEAFAEALTVLAALKAQGASRAQRLEALAELEGWYVPGYNGPGAGSGSAHEDAMPAANAANVQLTNRSAPASQVRRRVLESFANYPVVTTPPVPFAETTQDRLSVEIARGCGRACRFCAAGMTTLPVRERSADTVVAAITQGLAATGLDAVSLSALSATDHSEIATILRRLTRRYEDTDVTIALPSQRLDAFGVEMAALVCGSQKKGSLTFAPEAGTQRLRDVINKNVTEDDLVTAIRTAFGAGWRRVKLYFMMGLPTETDDDVRGIAALANLAYDTAKDAVPSDERGKVRMSVSVAVFVPKAHTPFQFYGQVPCEELERRLGVLKAARLHKGIDLHWHDPRASLIEAVYSRGDASLFELGVRAWELGARFDAWSDQFSLALWEQAAAELGLDLQACASRSFAPGSELPWGFISGTLPCAVLARSYERALAGALEQQVDSHG